MPTRQIMTSLRREQPEAAIKPQDIRNLRHRLRLEFLYGRSPLQALLCALPKDGDRTFNYEAEENVVTALFCIHKTSLELLQTNSYDGLHL
jgi:hypothetical protein